MRTGLKTDQSTTTQSLRHSLGHYVPLAFALAITVPAVDFGINGGLDGSWMIGLYKSVLQHLVFGKDIIFTYGPLGYLARPIPLDRTLWASAIFYMLASHVIFYSSVYLFIKFNNLSLRQSSLLLFVLLSVQQVKASVLVDVKTTEAILILCYIIINRTKTGYALPAFVGAFAGLLFFIKFSDGIGAFIMLSACCLFLLYERRQQALFTLLACYATSIIFTGLLSIGSLSDIIVFFKVSLEIASGYNQAMMNSGSTAQLIHAVLAWTAYGYLVYCSIGNRDRRTYTFLLLGFGYLFLSFKHAFIRHDVGHVYSFYTDWAIFFSLLACVIEPGADRKWMRRTSIAVFVALFVLFMKSLPGSTPSAILHFPKTVFEVTRMKWNILGRSLVRVFNASSNEPLYVRAGLSGFELSEDTLRIIAEDCVDIFPWDIALAEQYGLTWCPRPVFQSYSAYTATLDRLNSRHFEGEEAPEHILYAFKSIDKRYPLFDEPSTLMNLLLSYTPLKIDGEFLVLEKKRPRKNITNALPSSESEAAFFQKVEVPHSLDSYVIAHVHMEYSMIGRLLSILLKPPEVFIVFYVDNEEREHRFVPSTAKNGVLISQYVNDLDNLSTIWNGGNADNVEAIEFTTEYPIAFKRNIGISFQNIPKNSD